MPKTRFTREFQDEAVRLVLTSGRSQRAIADDHIVRQVDRPHPTRRGGDLAAARVHTPGVENMVHAAESGEVDRTAIADHRCGSVEPASDAGSTGRDK